MTTRPTTNTDWQGTQVEPSAPEKVDGFVAGDRPPAEYFNFLFGNTDLWIKYLDEQDSGLSRAMDALTNWKALTTGVSAVLHAIAMDPSAGRIVAVGENGTIISSINMGETWTTQTPGSSYAGDFFDVLWSSSLNLWVAVGESGEIQTSTASATAWTRRTTGTDLTAIAEGGGRLVAVGASASSKFSTNGTAWSAAGATPAAPCTQCVYDSNNGLFVATFETGVTTTSLQTSPDGSTWTAVTAAEYMEGVCFDSELGLVAEGRIAVSNSSARRIYHSADGASWALVSSHDPDDNRAVVSTGAGFVSLPEDVMRAGAYSRDGVTWRTDHYSAVDLQRASSRGLRILGSGRTRIAFSVAGGITSPGALSRSNAWTVWVAP